MARKSPYTIELSADARKTLEAVAGKYSSPYRDVEAIATRIDLPRQIVSKWRKRFYEEGLPGLQERSRRGRPPVFPPRRHRRD